MIDMAGMPPRCDRHPVLLFIPTLPTSRLSPGPVPTLGERLGTALRRSQSLEQYLSRKGEKFYSSKEEALSRLLQPPNSFIARWLFSQKGNIWILVRQESGRGFPPDLGFAILQKRDLLLILCCSVKTLQWCSWKGAWRGGLGKDSLQLVILLV